MKNKILSILLLIICITCFSIFFVGCNNEESSNENEQILGVYNMYVASAQESGQAPLSYEDWLASIKGDKGEDGSTPTIEISDDGYWVINGVKTEHKAIGKDGEKGDKGEDGSTPIIEISDDGYWVINGQKTDVKAKGEDGKDAITDNENPQGLDFYLKDDDTYAVAIGNACRLSQIVIPERYNGKIVNEIIESGFFVGSQPIQPLFTKIQLPKSITIIGDYAFSGCDSLTSINYNGTIAEWNSISKGSSWEDRVDATVYCTDGKISI